jgi:hypothetical protein
MSTSSAALKGMLGKVAADLGLDAGDDVVEHVATLRLARRKVLARMLRDDMKPNDPETLLRIDEALKPHQPKDGGLQIRVNFVEGVSGTYRCSACGEQNHLKDGTYTPVQSGRRDSVVPPANEPATQSTAVAPKATPAPVADNVVPLSPYNLAGRNISPLSDF